MKYKQYCCIDRKYYFNENFSIILFVLGLCALAVC